MTVETPLIDRLISFGYSRPEAQVYLYLLERGSEAGGSKIAVGAGLHRQYVYLALPRLIEEGLVEEVSHGKQHKYMARPPSEIEKIGRRRALQAGDLARELNLVSALGNEQDFEVVQGARAIQSYEMQMLDELAEGAEECILGGASTAFASVMGDSLPEYLSVKNEKKIRVRYLGTESERAHYAQIIGKYPNQEFRFMPDLPQGKTHLLVRPESVAFYSFLTPPLIYVVKSKEIADHYRAFFDMLWKMGK
jgi:sugar-specific transcriptional regulator TrmB